MREASVSTAGPPAATKLGLSMPRFRHESHLFWVDGTTGCVSSTFALGKPSTAKHGRILTWLSRRHSLTACCVCGWSPIVWSTHKS